MDWERYKALCDAPDVCSRWLLEQTLELLEAHPAAERLRDAMAAEPVEKPPDHRGGAPTDMFVLNLSLDEVAGVRRRIEQAAARGETTSATGRRGLGGFAEAWREYEAHLLGVPMTPDFRPDGG